MSRDNSRLWKAALANVPGLPECPINIAEPRYAAYLFGQHCFVSVHDQYPQLYIRLNDFHQACGKDRSSNMDHSLALLLCAKCYQTKYDRDSCCFAFEDNMHLVTKTQHISRFPRACESVQEFTTREEAEALFLLRRKCERVSFLYVETVRSLLICTSK